LLDELFDIFQRRCGILRFGVGGYEEENKHG
jgi:hypothetical protein